MTADESTRRLVIGLTGGIASGKSTAAEAFRRHGVPVIDADTAAREAVEPGQPALDEIIAAFGKEIVGPDGRLDRAELRRRVFADESARRRLEGIVHPRVREIMLSQCESAAGPYVILMIPLLVESHWLEVVDRVLVVDLPEREQLSRLMQRDGIDQSLAQRMIDAQTPRRERLARADDVLLNTGDPDRLADMVDTLHRRYLALATGQAASLPPQHLPASGE